jgi:hypothetical protein
VGLVDVFVGERNEDAEEEEEDMISSFTGYHSVDRDGSKETSSLDGYLGGRE